MGKFFALVIIVFMAVWLAPMCARLPTDLSTLSAPPAPAAPAEPVAVAPAPVAAPEPAPPAPAPTPKPAVKGAVGLATFRMRTMFPEENGKYVVSVLRANGTAVDATGVRMTLAARKAGEIIERAESGPAQTLAAGSTSYFGLGLSTFVLDEILDAPEDPGTGLEWTLTYRLASDPAGTSRCYSLNARPRRREPAGIDWQRQAESRVCPP